MASEVGIVKGHVAQHGARLQGHGDDYAAALRRVSERGAGGAAWRDDGLFGPLVSMYTEGARTGLDMLTCLAETINDSGDGMRVADATMRVADDASTLRLSGEDGSAWT
jgi:nitrogen-specific signal transduction histidine kinase